MKKSSWMVLIILLCLVFGMCIVTIDATIGILNVKSSLLEQGIYIEGSLTNGFWEMDPMQMYHVCMWMSFICMMSISMVAVHHLRLDKEVRL